jgi:hypothetical protein
VIDRGRDYSRREAAELADVSEWVVLSWCRKKWIAGARKNTGQWVIPGAGLSAWLDARAGIGDQLVARVRRYGAVQAQAREFLLEFATTDARAVKSNRLYALMRATRVMSVDELWALTPETVRAWAGRVRQRRQGRESPPRGGKLDIQLIKQPLQHIAARTSRQDPEWLAACAGPMVAATTPRSALSRWEGDPWQKTVEGGLSCTRGRFTQGGETLASWGLLRLCSFYRDAERGQPPRSLVSAVLDISGAGLRVAAAIDAEVRAKKRGSRTGAYKGSTFQRALDTVRHIFRAAALGRLTPSDVRAIAKWAGLSQGFDAADVTPVFTKWREKMVRHAVEAGLAGDAADEVRPPLHSEVQRMLRELDFDYRRLRDAHERRGLTLNDFLRWQEWDPDLRLVLDLRYAIVCLYTAAIREGSLHAQQPYRISEPVENDAIYADALVLGNVMAKTVKRETKRGPVTSSGHRLYDADLAPRQECTDWIVLGPADGSVSVREVLEEKLHAAGQCRGKASGCEASRTSVFRFVEIRWEGPDPAKSTPVYTETDENGATPKPLGPVSKHGEWLFGLHSVRTRVTRYNPMWWDRSGKKPLFSDGLEQRIRKGLATYNGNIEIALHRWRHYGVVYLVTAWRLSQDRAAWFAHMDPDTARDIYMNPLMQELLVALREHVASVRPSQAATIHAESDIPQLKERLNALESKLADAEHKVAYYQGLFRGKTPAPPPRRALSSSSSSATAPQPAHAPNRRAHQRRTPSGAAAFV